MDSVNDSSPHCVIVKSCGFKLCERCLTSANEKLLINRLARVAHEVERILTASNNISEE
jgi:hypothetical protein